MSTELIDHTAQTIDELSTRYQQLNEKKIQAQRDLDHAQERLDELKEKARQDYGTDDLEKLQEILKNMKQKNEEDRSNYQAGLDQIETELAEIDNKYSSAELAND
jgi:multidrug resistance efflux pump